MQFLVLALAIAILGSAQSAAALYRCVDAKGKTLISDTMCPRSSKSSHLAPAFTLAPQIAQRPAPVSAPNGTIRIIDHASRREGRYMVVEGIVRNQTATSRRTRVEVRTYDRHDKLISIEQAVVRPGTLIPHGEASFQAMLTYSDRMDRFTVHAFSAPRS